mmetsp:Transcript_124624/g.265862  ORF Transcript_124624/g.265862 Transcript_124624/m.265862 type:complete len:281 (-) Transcript_124624:1170-2012(-)
MAFGAREICYRALPCRALPCSAPPAKDLRPTAPLTVVASVVEESKPSEGHGHAVAIAGVDDLGIRHRPTWLGHVLHAVFGGMVDGIPEGEEGVGGDGDVCELSQELALLFCGEGLGSFVEVLLPFCELRRLHVSLDVADAGVHALLPFHAGLELQALHLLVESKAPCRHLPARKLHTVDTTLLSSTDTDHHTILGIPDGVGLGVLDSDGREDKVELRLIGKIFAFGRLDVRQASVVEDLVISLLHEAHATDHAVLHVRRFKVRIRLQDDELSALLRCKDF